MSKDHRKYFEKVQDPTDWRNPIKAIVPEDELAATMDAITYFTATFPTCSDNGDGTYLVMSEGYRNGPAGP